MTTTPSKRRISIYHRIAQMSRSVQYVYRSQNLFKLNMQCQCSIKAKENTSFTFSKIRRTSLFHVVVVQKSAKKCTKNYKARAKPLFCSLNLFFGGVLLPLLS